MANWLKINSTLRSILLIAIPAVAVDQISKHLAFKYFLYPSEHLPPNSYSLPLIENFLSLTCSRNTGVAFGLGQDMNLFFTIFTAVVIFMLLYYYRHFALTKASTVGFALVIGGAIGNLIDRVFYSAVRDFIDVHWYEHHWPIFNIADSCISVGVVLLLISSWQQEKAEKAALN